MYLMFNFQYTKKYSTKKIFKFVVFLLSLSFFSFRFINEPIRSLIKNCDHVYYVIFIYKLKVRSLSLIDIINNIV